MKRGKEMDVFKKRFSVGLNLGEPEEEIELFIREYCNYLSSIYFSLPLGNRFYSRTELKNEYASEEALEKLKRLVFFMRKNGVRSELTVNTYGLNKDDLTVIKSFVTQNRIVVDEIVCLDEYARIIKEFFPDTELKYSFNNKDPYVISDLFDTVVVGKKYLRRADERKRLFSTGKKVVFLLNNGCNFNCLNRCGNTTYCEKFLQEELLYNDVNYIYAKQSLFPDELRRLIEGIPTNVEFGFKISNRPLGLWYTKTVIDMYMCNDMSIVSDYLSSNVDNYYFFCTMKSLLQYRDQFDISEIRKYKAELTL